MSFSTHRLRSAPASLLGPVARRAAPAVDRFALRRYRALARRGNDGRDPDAVARATLYGLRRLGAAASLEGTRRPQVRKAVAELLPDLVRGDPRGVERPVAEAFRELVARDPASARTVVLEAFDTLSRTDPGAVRAVVLQRFQALARTEPDRVEAAALGAHADLVGRDLDGTRPAPAVRQAVVDQFHRLYYAAKTQTWQQTWFRGTRLLKNPLDLWLYQEVVHDLRPDVIVEAGTRHGGSAYYFASLLDWLGHGRVVTIDVDVLPGRPEHPRITYVTGSSTAPDVVAQVDSLIPEGARTLVVLDSDHSHKHVLEELRTWHTRVPVGSYVIVEDSNIAGNPVHPGFPDGGPMQAVEEFLAEQDDFVVDESMHKFFMTFNPRGFLKRVA